jgi:hypothetical protein
MAGDIMERYVSNPRHTDRGVGTGFVIGELDLTSYFYNSEHPHELVVSSRCHGILDAKSGLPVPGPMSYFKLCVSRAPLEDDSHYRMEKILR